jgi:hypothetical protein
MMYTLSWDFCISVSCCKILNCSIWLYAMMYIVQRTVANPPFVTYEKSGAIDNWSWMRKRVPQTGSDHSRASLIRSRQGFVCRMQNKPRIKWNLATDFDRQKYRCAPELQCYKNNPRDGFLKAPWVVHLCLITTSIIKMCFLLTYDLLLYSQSGASVDNLMERPWVCTLNNQSYRYYNKEGPIHCTSAWVWLQKLACGNLFSSSSTILCARPRWTTAVLFESKSSLW